MIICERLTNDAVIPTKAHETDLGWDLYAPDNYVLYSNDIRLIRTGIKLEFPVEYGAIIKDRSSMAIRGFLVLGGVIDCDYRGEIVVMLCNVTDRSLTIIKGSKVAQLLLFPVISETMKEGIVPNNTPRGEKGFGSSDIGTD